MRDETHDMAVFEKLYCFVRIPTGVEECPL